MDFSRCDSCEIRFRNSDSNRFFYSTVSLEYSGLEREFSDLRFFKHDFTVNGLELSRSCSIPVRLSFASAFIGAGLNLVLCFLLHYLI